MIFCISSKELPFDYSSLVNYFSYHTKRTESNIRKNQCFQHFLFLRFFVVRKNFVKSFEKICRGISKLLIMFVTSWIILEITMGYSKLMRNNFWFTFIYVKITKLAWYKTFCKIWRKFDKGSLMKLLQITGSLTVSSVDAFIIFMKTILLKQASAESRHQK